MATSADDELDPEPDPTATSWGLLEGEALEEAVAAGGDTASTDTTLLGSFLDLVDAATARVLDHPVRPRVNATPGGLLRGRLDLVQVEVPGVLASGLVIDRLVVRARDLRITPGLPPRVQAGPVSARAYVSQANVDRWTRALHLPLQLSLRDTGAVLSSTVRGIRVGEVHVGLEVSGRLLRLVPQRMTIAGLPAPHVRLLRGYLPLPALPRGARLTEVRHGDGDVAVTFELASIDEPLDADLLRRLRTVTRLPLPRPV